jgi:hypothetical protein
LDATPDPNASVLAGCCAGLPEGGRRTHFFAGYLRAKRPFSLLPPLGEGWDGGRQRLIALPALNMQAGEPPSLPSPNGGRSKRRAGRANVDRALRDNTKKQFFRGRRLTDPGCLLNTKPNG